MTDDKTEDEIQAAVEQAAREHDECKDAFEKFSATLVGKNSAVAIWFCGMLAARTLYSGLPQEEFEFSFNAALESNMKLIQMGMEQQGKPN